MAGRIQKPYDQLQNKRGNRRRPDIVLRPFTEDELDARMAAINVGVRGLNQLARSFGRGAMRTPAERTPAEAAPGRRRYQRRPKAERTPCPAKSAIAAARPRDEHGHFLPGERQRRRQARLEAARQAKD